MARPPDEPSGKSPPPIGRMAFHAFLAGIFFFALNRFALDQSLETSVLWGVVAAPFAAYMAYSQTAR